MSLSGMIQAMPLEMQDDGWGDSWTFTSPFKSSTKDYDLRLHTHIHD